MIRPAVLWAAFIVSAGCADVPDQTPLSEPVAPGDAASAPDGGPIPIAPGARRIETH
ncbi:hypothetical protein AB1L88_21190 [Tautonia sp. JC769]|uniref:hypothetical protein n=1 Tax=Tautonia sp. JC769 TaxID=3232135 RepID=UPI0034575711